MNRTRILSLIAVSVAGVVGVGMMFQQEPELAEFAPIDAPDAPVQVASASLLPAVPRDAAPAELEAPAVARLDPTDLVRPVQIDSPDMATVLPLAEIEPTPPEPAPLRRLPDLTGPLTAESQRSMLNDEESFPMDLAENSPQSCDVWLVATPDVGAITEISIFAPCHAGEIATISHGPLIFDAEIGADGQLLTHVPAMMADGIYEITLADGASAEDRAVADDFHLYDRVAIAWTGAAVLSLNAYEFGAEFGAAGHVHPGNADDLDLDAQGFMVLLGDTQNGARAQVYSFPSGIPMQSGSIRIEIEADITADSCGRILQATSMEAYSGSAVDRHDLTMHMPACSDIGGFLVLKNFLPDLTIAMN